jgi:hypothetical protein
MAVQQLAGITRTDLQRHDLSVAGREVVQNRVDISPEAPFSTYLVEKAKPLVTLVD